MAGEVNTELIISPSSQSVRDDLADASGWSAYAAELRMAVRTVIEKSGADSLEVGELLVGRPLPDEYSALRNGVKVGSAEAVGLVEAMVSGSGPYCRLSFPGRLQIESGWDGAVHLYVTSRTATDLAGLRGGELSLQWRDAVPEPVDVSTPVDAVADESFWNAVQEVSEGVTLVCERWAHGAYGCRWFRVTPENVKEVARLVRPRSLVCVAAAPELRPRPEILEDDFTAFVDPVLPGELAHRAYPGGADSLSDVTGEGFSLVLADKDLAHWCAVVPDPDGVVRAQWENPGDA
ncbi:hypothetical protein [Streptomyces laculatispora]|uniref:hypothetical protein n=1 Tax=Streptomyces laculatispora TaxID=887464 RepID=UPI001A943036|nr:hypothetical protein [Streptomyces laculatispora]MBO0918262.1 hypothetical protein [Streptomyces laculatispora]